MTQGEIEKLTAKTENIFSELEIRIMSDIVRRIKENGVSTASADWQLTRLQQLGMSQEEIQKYIQSALEASEKEMEKIFSDKAYEEYYGHERFYKFADMQQIPFEENIVLQRLIEATKEQLKGEYKNLTASMGFAIRDPATGKIKSAPLMDFYRSTMDNAVLDIQSGAFDYNTVLKRTIKQMTDSGIRYIDYDSGRRDRVNVAARRAVLTGFRQVQGKINEQVAAELHTNMYEVSYHVGARPSHQPWQGRVYSMEQLHSVCGLGTVTGLKGANCYHDYKPFPPGSIRTYTDEQLRQMNQEENTPKTYNGKEYTTYEALQQQRKMERGMRAQRQQIKLLQSGEADEQDIILAKAKYQGQMQTYKDFSEKMKLPEQKTRITQDGLRGRFMPTKAEMKQLPEKNVSKQQNPRELLKQEIADKYQKQETLQAELDNIKNKEKQLTQKIYFDLSGTQEEMEHLKQIPEKKKEIENKLSDMKKEIFEKQEIYKNNVEQKLIEDKVVKKIEISRRMTPESVDQLEETIRNLHKKYGEMPNVVYSPKKVEDATATYNWLDDTIYISNNFDDPKKYLEKVEKSEHSLIEYNKHYDIKNKAKQKLEEADAILADKSIKGYEREKARLQKVEAEIQINETRIAVRENLQDCFIHEYGHFIHRHANINYTQKKEYFGMKELGGYFRGDWEYEVSKQYSARGKVNASNISRYAAKNPYETFAEGFLALEKGEKIPEEIAEIIEKAKRKIKIAPAQ